jgi:hypothetical protein
MNEMPALPDVESPLPDHYFEIYNLAVEMADRISARRVLANSFFATVNTALVALIGAEDFPWYVAAAGIVLSVVWWALLKSYRDLNTAKFQVINAMEERLPVKIFSDEWRQLKKERLPFRIRPRHMRDWLAQYRELGAVERIVPWLFALLYGIEMASRVSWPDTWRIC